MINIFYISNSQILHNVAVLVPGTDSLTQVSDPSPYVMYPMGHLIQYWEMVLLV